jgi:hypothetical protein
VAIWRALHNAGSGSAHHRNLSEQFNGWAMVHGHDLLNLTAGAFDLPAVEPLEQNTVTAPDVDIRGTRPRQTEGVA